MKKLMTIFIILAIISIIVIPRVMNQEKKDGEEITKVITVEGEVVERQSIGTTIDLIGSTFAMSTIPVLPPVPAEVETIHVAVGDYVEEGQILFTMNPEDVEKQLTQAKLSVDQANAAASQANVGVSSAKESIKSAELAYELAKSNYEMNLENYQFAVDNLEKNKTLYEEGVISEVEYEQMRLQASPETLNILKKQLEQAEQGLNQARLGANQAGASYSQASVGINMAKEGYERASETLNDLDVRAPVSGYVTTVNITENAMATNQQAAIIVEDLGYIKVLASVTPETVLKINQGDMLNVIISGYETPFVGEVTAVSLSANNTTRLYPIEVIVENKEGLIRPGMFATIQVVDEKNEQGIVVPSAAVRQHENGYIVYRVIDDTKVEVVDVEIGIDTGYNIEIVQGLSEGDVVITKGAGLINEESELNVIRGGR